MSETVCIIPARGGSKGIPGKNIVNFCGAPLVTWNIQAALESKSIDRTFVSTDSAEIAEIAKAQGAEVINRPVEISGDTASSESALLHALNVLKEDGYSPETLVFLQCTSPLTTSDDIDGTIKLMKNKNADSAFTCARFYEFLWRCDETGNVNGINHDKKIRERRQDRAPEFIETGAVYIMKVAGFLKHKHRFFDQTVIYEVPKERVFQIDDPSDLVVTAAMMSSGMYRPKER